MNKRTNLKKYFETGIDYNQYLNNEEALIQSTEEFEFRPYHELNERRMKRNNKIAEKSIQISASQKEMLTNKKNKSCFMG